LTDSPEVDEYRSWCRLHVRESPGFDLADAAIAELEGYLHSSADWLRAQTAEAELAEAVIERDMNYKTMVLYMEKKEQAEAELEVQRELRRTDNAAGAKLDEELRAKAESE